MQKKGRHGNKSIQIGLQVGAPLTTFIYILHLKGPSQTYAYQNPNFIKKNYFKKHDQESMKL